MTKHHLPLFPKHKIYVEPFCGSAKLLIAKPPSAVEVINDIDPNVINYFRVMQDKDKRAELIKMLKLTPYSRAEFNRIRDIYLSDSFKDLSDTYRAYIFFYLNQICFSAIMVKPAFGTGCDSPHSPSYYNHIDGFNELGERLQGVIIECADFRDIFRKYDSDDTFFYTDPPYLNSGKGMLLYDFTIDDHKDLLRMVKNVKGMVMVCGFNTQLYNDELNGWHKMEFTKPISAGYGSPKRKHRTECAWLNYDP